MTGLSVTQEVTQADRDAAADYLDSEGWDWGACGDVRKGVVHHPVVALIANVRLAAEAATREECAVEFPSWFVPCVLTAADNGNALTLSAQDIKALAFRIRQLGGDHDAD